MHGSPQQLNLVRPCTHHGVQHRVYPSTAVRLLVVTTGWGLQIAILVVLSGPLELYEGYFEHN